MSQVIFLVDDEPTVLKAMRQSLEQLADVSVVCFEDGEGCLQRLGCGKCHLLITDVSLPGMDGLVLLEEVKRIRPQLPVLLITGYGDIPMAVRAVKQGAVDFLEKPLDESSMLPLVRDILAEARGDSLVGQSLTRAEQAVLTSIVQGRTNKEIAEETGRSVRTVENHRARIMRKLDVDTMAAMIRVAIEMGYVPKS